MIMTNNFLLKAITLSTLIFALSACSILPNLSWLGLVDDTVPYTNETEIPNTQQASMSTETELTQTNLQSNASAVQNSKSYEKMEKHLKEWQDMKPSIARLTALEAEVKELTKQLKNMNANSAANARIIDPSPQVMENSITTGSKVARQKNSIINTENMYAIQLFSLMDKNIIRRTWDNLSTKHPNILGTLSPIYEEVSMQGKTFYRVKAGSFETKRAAMQLCESLRSANTHCFLARSTGIAI
jgi:hypothetical protein